MKMRYYSWVQIDEQGSDLKPEPNKAGVTVYELESRPMQTGLLDVRGFPIMRDDGPKPVGFIRFATTA